MSALRFVHRFLRAINDRIFRFAMALGTAIVGFMVLALTASAVTRYTTGTGYDAYIEMPPVLVPWLVFPLLGPLLRQQEHITVDVLPIFLSERGVKVLRLALNLVTIAASIVFMVAGIEAVELFMGLGQMLELEIEFPIWYMYLAFPVGFLILISFAVELALAEILDWNGSGSERGETEPATESTA